MNKLILCKYEPDDFDDIFIDIFPIVKVDSNMELFGLEVNNTEHGYLCFEYVNEVCVVHPYFMKKYRTKDKMIHLRKGFLDVVKPYLKDKGVKSIVAQCDYKDDKAMRLHKFFGFDPVPIWISSMEV